MDFTITSRSMFLHVEAWGEFSFDAAKQMFVDIAAAAAGSSAGKVLIDGLKVTGNLTIGERVYYGEFAADTVSEQLKKGPYARGPQFAYVLNEPLVNRYRFVETVARNRGMDVRVFYTLDEARKWLGLAPEEI